MLVAALGHEWLLRAAGIPDRLRNRIGALVFPCAARLSDCAGLVCYCRHRRAGGWHGAGGCQLQVARAGRSRQFSRRQSRHDPAGPGDDSPIRVRDYAIPFQELDHLRPGICRTVGNACFGFPWYSILGGTRMERRDGGTAGSLSTSSMAYLCGLRDFKKARLGALKRAAIPLGQRGTRFVCAFEETEQRLVRRRLLAQIFIKIDELAEGVVVAGLGRLDRCGLETFGRRSGITIKPGLAEASVAGPEAGADHFMRVGLAGDFVRSLARRGGSSGKARDRQVKATPEEMNRADLAHKPGGKLLKDSVRMHQHSPEAVSGMAVVGGVLEILSEGNWVLQFYRHRVDLYADTECGKTSLVLQVELRHRLGAQRSRHAGAGAHHKFQFMADEVEGDLKKF